MAKTFELTVGLNSDPMNHAHDVSYVLARAAEDIEALGGNFDVTKSGTVEDIQGIVLASWCVSEEPTDVFVPMDEDEDYCKNCSSTMEDWFHDSLDLDDIIRACRAYQALMATAKKEVSCESV